MLSLLSSSWLTVLSRNDTFCHISLSSICSILYWTRSMTRSNCKARNCQICLINKASHALLIRFDDKQGMRSGVQALHNPAVVWHSLISQQANRHLVKRGWTADVWHDAGRTGRVDLTASGNVYLGRKWVALTLAPKNMRVPFPCRKVRRGASWPKQLRPWQTPVGWVLIGCGWGERDIYICIPGLHFVLYLYWAIKRLENMLVIRKINIPPELIFIF